MNILEDSNMDDKMYCIDGINLSLGENHMLPNYQERFCMYDRIIPYLASISNNGTIIDIGANVGDTVVSMIKHTNSRFLCIEPNNDFYEILCKNIEMLPREYIKRIKLKKAFISQKMNENYIMDTQHGTAKKVLVDYATKTESITLKNCIDDANITYQDIKLIKVDTDGFDYECIMSMEDILGNISPLLYWENAFEVDDSFDGYSKLNDYLKQNQYEYFFIFDNFGNYLSEGNNEFLQSINDYLNRMKKFNTGRTFFYVDVIACKSDKVEVVRKMIQEYISEFN